MEPTKQFNTLNELLEVPPPPYISACAIARILGMSESQLL